jgi:hypothetical protein
MQGQTGATRKILAQQSVAIVFLASIARVHIEAVSAVVHLRGAQIRQLDQLSGEAALHYVAMDTPSVLMPAGAIV